jgi:hypothetical protein
VIYPVYIYHSVLIQMQNMSTSIVDKIMKERRNQVRCGVVKTDFASVVGPCVSRLLFIPTSHLILRSLIS